MPDEVTLPVLIAGEQREPSDDAMRLKYESGVEVLLHRPTVEEALKITASDRRPLRDLSIDDITIFYDRVRQQWMDPDNRWRRLAVELGSRVTGYARQMIESDVNYLGHTLDRLKQYDFIETDLGDPALLDEWRPTKAVYLRCWPKGLISHIMVGNVPLASLFTLYRSTVTKNITVAKLPSRDVVSALCFANCIYETDPEHPVTRALSVLYWEPGSKVEDVVIEKSDVVSVWGRGDTVDAIKRRMPHGTDLIEFGPKRSFAMIMEGVEDADRLAMQLAYDVVLYDQEGCFSTQEVFVQEGVDEIAQLLAKWLETIARHAPRRVLSPDGEAHVQRARMEATADGWRVIASEATDWTVVVTDGPTRLEEHPLSRFVYLHPIADLDEVLATVDRDVQTVSVWPPARALEFADPLTAAGADRVVQIGRVARFRPGFTHDGMHPMRRMVRWVSLEREIAYKYRFTAVSPAEYEARLLGSLIGGS